MSLNTSLKVPMPKSKWVLSPVNKSGIQYVRYLVSSERKSSNYVKVNRVNIGIYDVKSQMLIPNNNYFKIFKESSLSVYTPKSIRDYGNYYLFYHIISTIGLLDVMKNVFSSNWDKLLTIAMYMLSEDSTMYYLDDYCDETFLLNNTYVTSQETTNIFKNITEDDKIRFFKEWVKVRNSNECIAYDITSISSYSKQLSFTDYGYNRDNEDLPQINLGMFYGLDSKLPLIYDIYNDAIGDKTHFESMLKYAKSYDIKNVSLVMDRGFFKKDNIMYLYDNNIPFIMGISLTSSLVNEKIIELKNSIKSSKNRINSELIHGKQSIITINNKTFKIHLFYDHRKYPDELSLIENKIRRLEYELINVKNIIDVKRYQKYFKLTVIDGKVIQYEKNYQKIDEASDNAGFFALISSRMDLDIKDILQTYRRKDDIEKTYDNMKNFIDFDRMKVHQDSTMLGKTFVVFLSLIIKSYIDGKMKDDPRSVKKIINELKKIKLQSLINGEEYIAPLTKKQKEILDMFNITEQDLKEGTHTLPL